MVTQSSRREPNASVVLATYNQSAILPLVLRFLLSQDYPGPWELLVCDDGSNEDVFQVIRSVPVPRNVDLRYCWQPRAGDRRTKSRNNGLLSATGKVVVLLDGDLLVTRDFLSKHLQLHRDGRRVVYAARRWIFAGDLGSNERLASRVDTLMEHPAQWGKLYSDIPFQEKYERTHPWISCLGCNFSFARNSDPILFDEAFIGWGSEDQEFAFRLKTLHGYEFHFAKHICSLHVDHRSQKDFVPMRPANHADIVQCLRNILYFRNKYSYEEIAPACNGIGYYRLDRANGEWSLADHPNCRPEHVMSMLAEFETWLLKQQT